jgi:hypothetical protein
MTRKRTRTVQSPPSPPKGSTQLYVKRGRKYKVLTGKGANYVATLDVPEKLSKPVRVRQRHPAGVRRMERSL